MGDHDNPSTCLSANVHGDYVRDSFLHYFGRLRVNERRGFLATLPPHKQDQIEAEEIWIRGLRANFEEDLDTKLLVDQMKLSLADFQKAYTGQFHRTNMAVEQPETSTSNHGPATSSCHPTLGLGCTDSVLPVFIKPCKENAFLLSSNMAFFKESKPFTDIRYPDQFPDQRIPLQDILYSRNPNTNPLTQKCEKDMIRYFHLPGNNMDWIEEAMARYYNEERPHFDGQFRWPENPSNTYMLLRPEFWRGQQRHDAVHTRHMRPCCNVISNEHAPKLRVLGKVSFSSLMPYLHWETERQTNNLNTTIEKIAGSLAMDGIAVNPWQAGHMRRKWTPPNENSFKIINTATEAVYVALQAEVASRPWSKFSRSSIAKNLTSRMAPTTSLGRFLYRAALLYTAMNYQEHASLKAYLYNNPPFSSS
ncbi:hypothetical protein IFR05_007138 [Cadophora sp. M221]|nr:hypothetical protein IFR05_007138 [Cadophora sp. M221]